MALPTGWFTIDKAYIEQLDQDSYRFRIHTNWGGDSWLPDGVTQPISPSLTNFNLGFSLGTAQYNLTHNSPMFNAPTFWRNESWDFEPAASLGYIFGYDFDLISPITEPFAMSYGAIITWSAYSGLPGSYGNFITYEQNFTGNMNVEVVPEPGTLILIAFGLAGITPLALRRKDH